MLLAQLPFAHSATLSLMHFGSTQGRRPQMLKSYCRRLQYLLTKGRNSNSTTPFPSEPFPRKRSPGLIRCGPLSGPRLTLYNSMEERVGGCFSYYLLASAASPSEPSNALRCLRCLLFSVASALSEDFLCCCCGFDFLPALIPSPAKLTLIC